MGRGARRQSVAFVTPLTGAMLRPLKAINVIHQRMAAMLQSGH